MLNSLALGVDNRRSAKRGNPDGHLTTMKKNSGGRLDEAGGGGGAILTQRQTRYLYRFFDFLAGHNN
jgi:hypothetical protein